MSIILIIQMQFLALLSLVNMSAIQDSFLGDFISNLRWINLWVPLDPPGELEDTCNFSVSDGNLSALIFVGNLALVVGILLGVLLLHVAVVSGVEAYWLWKDETIGQGDIDDDLGDTSERDNGGSDTNGPQAWAISQSRIRLVERCRQHSGSPWLYFPHIELIFLLFAFEGAVAAQASAIRSAHCVEIVIAASLALGMKMFYPAFMYGMLWRTVMVRVRPDDMLVFRRSEERIGWRDIPSRFRKGWKEDRSLFSWADKGHWESARAPNTRIQQDGDWFRIGFEPIFIDHTKNGSWYILVHLVQVACLALASALVDDPRTQLFLLFSIHFTVFVIIVITRPFVNRIIDFMTASVVLIDAVSSGLLWIASRFPYNTSLEKQVGETVTYLHALVLLGILIPIYLDTCASLMGTASRTLGKAIQGAREPKTDMESREMVRRRSYSGYSWCMLWVIMLRHNLFACVRDTRAGVRRSRLHRTSSSRWTKQQSPQVQGQTSHRALSTIQEAPNEKLPEDHSGLSERWNSELEAEEKSKHDAPGSNRNIIVHRASNAERGELIVIAQDKQHPQSTRAHDSTSIDSSSQHGTIPWRRPVLVDVPTRRSGRVLGYATEDNNEHNGEESENTARGVEASSEGVRARDPKLARRMSIKISGRAPTEEDVPRRLPDRFSQYQIPYEGTTDPVATLLAKTNDKRPDQEVMDTGELAGDAEMDRGETSSSRPPRTDYDSTFRAASWQRPVAVDFPRTSSGQASTYATEGKNEQSDYATKADTDKVENSATDIWRRDPKLGKGVSVRIGGTALTEDDLPRRLSSRFNRHQMSQQGAAETVATPGMDVDKGPDTDEDREGRARHPERGGKQQSIPTFSRTDGDNPFVTASWQRPVAVDMPRRSSERGPMYATEESEEQKGDRSEAIVDDINRSDSGIRIRATKLARGVSIPIGGWAPTEQDVPRRLSERFSQNRILQEDTCEVVASPEITIDQEPNTTGDTRGHVHHAEIDGKGRSSPSPSLADCDTQFVATSWHRPVTVDIPRRGSGRESMYATKDDEEPKVDATDPTGEGVWDNARDVRTRTSQKFITGVSFRISGKAPTEDDLPRRLSRRFSQCEIQQETAEAVETSQGVPTERSVDLEVETREHSREA